MRCIGWTKGVVVVVVVVGVTSDLPSYFGAL
jgi:hypothetical protein